MATQRRMTVQLDGFYGLASLDGGPLSGRDSAAVGVSPAAATDGFAMVARDRGVDVPVAGPCALLGHLDEPEALAAALRRDPATPPADLVLAAVARYGDDAPVQVAGEWAFAHWDACARRLTLMVSDTARDPLLFSTNGRRVAVAPHVRVLRGLDGIGATPGGRGMLLPMGRAAIRDAMGDETILDGVRMVVPGTRVRIARAGVTVGARAPFPVPTRWQGSFADAIEALDDLLRRMLRERLARHPHTAVMLSGGLDSSLIAAFAAAERAPGSTVFAVTSAAPAGSGLLDEVEFSRAVADQARMPMIPVAPGDDADAYLPTAQTLDWLQRPVMSPRHYIYDALYAAAAERGAGAILDGCDGEWTLTGYADETGWRQRLRAVAGRTLRRSTRVDAAAIQDAFHVRLSAQAIAWAGTELAPALRASGPAPTVRGRDDVCGYAPAIAKNARVTTETHHPGLRRLFPFHDRRLLTLFAGMPHRFLTEGGLTRAPARALLAGKVPERVRLRMQGRPFSPDYRERIHRHAPRARARLADQARAGAGEWLDLAWLDGALARIESGATVSLDMVIETQMTACAAAFIAVWSAQA